MKHTVQYYIGLTAHEEDQIWHLISEISQDFDVSRERAFQMIKDEIEYIKSRKDIEFVTSTKLYDIDNYITLDKDKLLSLTLEEVEFKQEGPFYYLI